MSERRKSERLAVRDCIVECTKKALLGFLKKPFCATYPLIDISSGGLQILTNETMRTGLRLHLRLSVPKEKNPVTCTGKVIWSRMFPQKIRGQEFHGVGVKFTGFDGPERDRFLKMLESGRFQPLDFHKAAEAAEHPHGK